MRHIRREGVVTKREARPLWHDFLLPPVHTVTDLGRGVTSPVGRSRPLVSGAAEASHPRLESTERAFPCGLRILGRSWRTTLYGEAVRRS
jgi:hypothetical protein